MAGTRQSARSGTGCVIVTSAATSSGASIQSIATSSTCPELKLCIEVDGQSHDTDETVLYDARRTRILAAHGVTVVRLRNEHIDEQPDGAWSLIVAAVDEARAQGMGRESRPSP